MKKKIMALCMCLCMLAIAIVGGTMAYFTDEQAQTNTFTAGKVDIILYESKVVKDTNPESETFGNLIVEKDADGNALLTQKNQEYHLYPAMTVAKDPTIRVEAGSEDAYIAAKVTVNNSTGDIHDLIGIDYGHMLALQGFLEGGCAVVSTEQEEHPLNEYKGIRVYGDGTYSVYQDIIKNDDKYTYVFYVFIEDVQSAGDTRSLFTQMNINSDWDNDEMAIMNGVSIDIEAYGVQANGFTNCFDAMTAAFGKEEGDPFYFDLNN